MVVRIELLVTRDCPHGDSTVDLIRTALADTGVGASMVKTNVATQEDVQRYGFVGSPTILINGEDPFPKPAAGLGMTCRLYAAEGEMAGIPPLPALREALKRAADR